MTSYPESPLSLLFLRTRSPTRQPNVRRGERIDIPLPKVNPETGQPLALLPCPFSMLLQGEEFDEPEGSLLLVGTQYVVKPGDGAVLVVMLAHRRADFTHEAFRERWLNGHAPFGLQTAASGYRQLHPREEPGPEGFDGAGLVFFRDLDHVANARAAPEIARAATRDEMQFIDHSRSMLAMFRFS